MAWFTAFCFCALAYAPLLIHGWVRWLVAAFVWSILLLVIIGYIVPRRK